MASKVQVALGPLIDPTSLQFLIDRAANRLICHHPFYAVLWASLKKVELTHLQYPDGTLREIDTMATDGTHLFMNPQFVRSLEREELVGVCAHEVMHVAQLHPWRRNGRDPFDWNLACDAVVNYAIGGTTPPLTLPKGCVPGIPGKSAEEVYQWIQKERQEGRDPYPQFSRKGTSGDPSRCGGIVDPRDASGLPLSEAEAEQQMSETRVRVQQALNAQKLAGTLPAGLSLLAGTLNDPVVPWREVLARFLSDMAKNDYSWMRPNPRYRPFILPSSWSPTYGKILLGADMSGSMMGCINAVCNEIRGVLDKYMDAGNEPKIDVAWFDTVVYHQEITDPEELKPQGCGGTDFGPVFRFADEMEPTPKAVIMLTDGYGSFGEPPECPVLWILTEYNGSFNPPFGEVTCVMHE